MILGAKMMPKAMPTPPRKCVEFLIDFWRFLGYQNEAQMAVKSVPDPIIFGVFSACQNLYFGALA